MKKLTLTENQLTKIIAKVINEQDSTDGRKDPIEIWKTVQKLYHEDRTGVTRKLYPNVEDLAEAIADGYKYWDSLKMDFGRLQIEMAKEHGVFLPSLPLMEFLVDNFKT